jgi:hypothetical protein
LRPFVRHFFIIWAPMMVPISHQTSRRHSHIQKSEKAHPSHETGWDAEEKVLFLHSLQRYPTVAVNQEFLSISPNRSFRLMVHLSVPETREQPFSQGC